MEKSRFKTFGQYLAYIRLSKGLSLSDLSLATGIVISTLSRYENNKLVPTKDNMINICEVLHESAEEMNEMWKSFQNKD